jgi:hypothetical protein
MISTREKLFYLTYPFRAIFRYVRHLFKSRRISPPLYDDANDSEYNDADDSEAVEFLNELDQFATRWKQREARDDNPQVSTYSPSGPLLPDDKRATFTPISQQPMNGKDYVKYLEAWYGGEDEERLKWIRKNLHKHDEELGNKFWWSWQFDPKYDSITTRLFTAIMSETVFYPFLETLPPSIQQSFKNVAFGVLPIRAVNAQTCRAPNGDPVVVVDAGLLHIVQTFDRAAVHFKEIKGKWNRLDTIYQAYQSIISFYHTGELIDFPELSFNRYSPRREATLMSRALSVYVFIIAHELAHISAGHLEKAPVRSLTPPKGIPQDFYQLSQQMEYEADKIAWRWYKNACEHMPALQYQSKASESDSPLTFFFIASLLDKNLRVPDQYSTHPPAIKRMERLIRTYHLNDCWNMLTTARTMPTTEMMRTFRAAMLEGKT